MEKLIGPAVSLAVSLVTTLITIGLAWGKMIMKVENNKEDIERFLKDCGAYRSKCHDEISKKMDDIFNKLDQMKTINYDSITKLSIQIAHLEEKMDKR